MPQTAQATFSERVFGLAESRNASIKTIRQNTGHEIKAMVLEEISDLNPFPQTLAGHARKGSRLEWDSEEIKIDGILVLTPRQSGYLPHLGDYFILKRDGLYQLGIFCNDEPRLPNVDYFRTEGAQGGKLASDEDYLTYYKPIVEAIGKAKGLR